MNNIMKTLTLFTVLLTLPTLVFSFFGMNVPLPIDDHSYVSWIIVVGISLILAIVSIFYGKNKIITTNTLSYRLALNLKGIIICLNCVKILSLYYDSTAVLLFLRESTKVTTTETTNAISIPIKY